MSEASTKPAETKPSIQAPHEAIRFGLCTRSNEKNTAPVLDYIEDVEAFLAKQGIPEKCDDAIEELNRLHRGLKIHQQKLFSERADLQRRAPDLKENIQLIKMLKEQDKSKVRFMAADGVWVDGLVESPTDGTEPKVALWLGANVMMEYPYDEAEDLLSKSAASAEAQIESKTKDLLFLKEQLTMCEVTVARFYNYEVARKRRLRQQEEENNKAKSTEKQ